MDQTDISIPPAPRPLNSRARSRSWNERPVRLAIILLVLIGAIAVYFSITRIQEAQRERGIILRGEPVDAKVTWIENSLIANRREANVNGLRIRLNYTPPNAEPVTDAPGKLLPSEPPQVAVGDTLKVKVDPLYPQRWTTRTQPAGWLAELLFVWPFVPLVGLLLGWVFWSRQRVLSIWKNGVEAEAAVIDAKQSSLAPQSRVVRYVLADGDDPTVHTLLCPTKSAPAAGDSLHIIHAPNRPDRAIAAHLYL